MNINIKAERVYKNRFIREWWISKTEENRRSMVREYFHEGNSESIDTLYGIMPEELEEIYLKNKYNKNIKIVSWEERKKYGYLGFYILNKDIYEYIPQGWNQKPKLEMEKYTIIEVVQYKDRNVYEEQFHTRGKWFKRSDINPIKILK